MSVTVAAGSLRCGDERHCDFLQPLVVRPVDQQSGGARLPHGGPGWPSSPRGWSGEENRAASRYWPGGSCRSAPARSMSVTWALLWPDLCVGRNAGTRPS